MGIDALVYSNDGTLLVRVLLELSDHGIEGHGMAENSGVASYAMIGLDRYDLSFPPALCCKARVFSLTITADPGKISVSRQIKSLWDAMA